MSRVYEWFEFKEVLDYLQFDPICIIDFEEHYMNLDLPIQNFERFIQFQNTRGTKNE